MASEKDIIDGKVTDVYFTRTKKTLEHLGLKDLKVRMEVHAYGLPENYEWAVFAGLEEALKMLEGKPFNVYAMPEGSLFKQVEPLLIVEGTYYDFATYETALLGILRHSSSISTKAARVKLRALDKPVIFFGLRAVHPAIAPMVDRAAYIGGLDGVAGEFSEETLKLKPTGTMPHALMLAVGDSERAWRAFDEAVEPEVPRIVLVDTFDDERVETMKAVRVFGERLAGVRLDTPSSRRGNMKKIVQEIRWTLSLEGYKNVRIMVSGGLDEDRIEELKDVVDAFGVGTSIAFPPSVDLSMDIVEKEEGGKWIPVTKRGKWPGAKQVIRCGGLEDTIVPWSSKDNPRDGCVRMLRKYMEQGRIIEALPSPSEIRDYVLKQLRSLISQ